MPLSVIIFIICFFISLRSLFNIAFSLNRGNRRMHKKRLKELKFSESDSQTDDEKIVGLIELITKPIIQYVLPNLRIKNRETRKKELKLAKWDKYMNVDQYYAVSILSKVIAFIYFIIFVKSATFLAIIVGLIGFILTNFLLSNSIKNRRARLLIEFPDFIRMTGVFLESGLTFQASLLKSIESVGDEWEEIIVDMSVVAAKGDIKAALDVLQESFDIVEVKEFVSILKTTMDQGGDISDAFNAQADKVKELYADAKEVQIEKRKNWATLLQLPILIALMLAYGLPIIGQVMSFTGM